MSFAGEAVRFDLAAHRSTVTRQMVQVRVRLTAQAFGAGTGLVAANVTADGMTLEVDAAALLGANAAVRAGLKRGPAEAVVQLRRLSGADRTLRRRASAFAATLTGGDHPGHHRFVRYVAAAATYQAMGALKFCVPDSLRRTLAAWLPAPGVVDTLLAPDAPTLWSIVRRRELTLADARLRLPAAEYRRRLEAHRRTYGYLLGEDVDFQAAETLDAIDARLAALAAGDVTAERRRLNTARAADVSAKARARTAFAARLADEDGDGVATLVSQVLLARALAAHEDRNRRAKMRLLRDLRDLAGLVGLDIERAGLAELAAGRHERGVAA